MRNDSVIVSAVSSDAGAAVGRVFDALPIAACLVDGSGRIVRATAPVVAQWRSVEVGDDLHDALRHLDRRSTGPCVDERCALRGPLVFSGLRREREAFRADRSIVVFDWLSAPWPEADAGTAIVLLRDVTVRHYAEQEAAQQQRRLLRTTRNLVATTRARDQAVEVLAAERRRLQSINRELDQFAYAASHDLKAPLRGIANLAQWIEEDLQAQLKEGTREMLALMRSRMHRMEALIEGLLQFARAGRVHEEPETVDTAAVVADVVELLSPPEEALVLLAPGMPTFLAERVPLRQVFANLIGNAIKHAGRSDVRVFIDAASRDGVHQFAVTDNGPGIAREFHERVWEIFQSLQPHDQVEGAGIGLALVKKIVEARGGRVALESEPGEGSRFSFTWPEAAAYEETWTTGS